jgi:hypothetical protein
MILKEEVDYLHTSFFLAFCIQLSFKLLISDQEHLVHGAHPRQLILKILSFSNPPKGCPQELIIRPRMLYDFLNKKKNQNQETSGNLK